MPSFTWKAEYSVNIQAIDQQHQLLVAMIDRLHQALLVGKGDDTINGLLEDLIEYTQEHFGLEEQLMNEYEYPNRSMHQRAHARLTAEVVKYQRRRKAGEDLTLEIFNFLQDWLINHILGMDQQFGPYLNARGVK